jgi:chemotaxis family two-component system response regulator Rcp1
MDLFLIRSALESAQIAANIHVAGDGNVATTFFDAADDDPNAPCPAVVLLDLNLPRKSGAEVLRHLRNSKRCSRAQVLIVSTSDAARDRSSVEGMSVAGYFKKPSEYAEFMKLGPLVIALLQSASREGAEQ